MGKLELTRKRRGAGYWNFSAIWDFLGAILRVAYAAIVADDFLSKRWLSFREELFERFTWMIILPESYQQMGEKKISNK